MTTLTRWLRFNLVGLLGMALQLTTLHVLNRTWPRHYLLTTTAALELTLLHNFLWHWHSTWRDHRTHTRWRRALLRFHLTNGLTSLIGTLTLMPLFLRTLHAPLLLANALAILTCSLANFLFTHLWSFASSTPESGVPHSCTVPSHMGGEAS